MPARVHPGAPILVMNHSVNVLVNPAFRAGVRYYEIRKTTPSGAWSVQEQGTMSGGAGDLLHRWMGSTSLNAAGSQAVGYSVSSATVFPSIRYAGRLSGDLRGWHAPDRRLVPPQRLTALDAEVGVVGILVAVRAELHA